MGEFYGAARGLFLCNNKRTVELDNRIYERNLPSTSLQPQFSMRPVSTKYTVMPILDERKGTNVPITQHLPYNLKNTFNPGNATAPWGGYVSNINQESILRNQFFALQNCEQSVYIPSSHSSLYNNNIPFDASFQQPYQDLFDEQNFEFFNPNPDINKVGYDIFNNNTRTQLMNLDC